ncbi:hypothetical protein S140_102 [Shewanella sp. phage 1/40]|nr:hypothetical protein S140_102 [Shewanella sp. phage 1/40]AHK11509.1 hypothetical protein S140_102 [Shewanella sp. phage 1/40]
MNDNNVVGFLEEDVPHGKLKENK